MALDAALRQVLRRIAEAIEKYARSHGWAPDDYRWYYRINLEWGHILLILVAPEFEGVDYHEAYQELTSFLGQELTDEPGLARSIGLVLRTPKQVSEGGIYTIGPEFEEYEDPRAPRPVKS